MTRPRAILLIILIATTAARAQDSNPSPTRADKELAEYFRAETELIERRCLTDLKTPQDWEARRPEMRRQLAEMLGLDPMPEKTDLRATVTGRVEGPSFTVENLHFQSRPGLYVTANLYLPKNADEPVPAVLYVCGHAPVKKGDVSYGNKTAYQHHAIWFASNGYACLVIDSLQLGEIEGIHHGTYREKMWWWNSRGYTPAGVEAWNCIRALDYLQSRKEVDGGRLGVTGRSGGGAYSWWLSALDERCKVAVPVAGISDLHNHVVDGCVEGHCDCMFFVNTYRWDYPMVAALVAPRPLLLANTDKDSIFPLDGVTRLYWKTRQVYGLGVQDEPYHPFKKDLGLQVSEGGHKDTPELQIAAFRWFNRFLKGKDDPIDMSSAKKLFEPEQLRVFKDGLPKDAINAKIHETFVPMAPEPKVPETQEEWVKQRDAWMQGLKDKCFRGWPENGGGPLDVKEVEGGYEFNSQPHVRLRLRLTALDKGSDGDAIVLRIGEKPSRKQVAGTDVWFDPRGANTEAWSGDEKKQTQIRRRFMLLGQTVEGMQAWDVRRAIQAVRSIPELKERPLKVLASNETAGVVLYASLFEPAPELLFLQALSPSHTRPPAIHTAAPHFINVLRVMDIPHAVALAAERGDVVVFNSYDIAFPNLVAEKLKWPEGRLGFGEDGGGPF